jgi:hypothetical protein
VRYFKAGMALMLILLFGIAFVANLPAADNEDQFKYDYHIKHVQGEKGVNFYFFRIAKDTGRIEFYGYENKSSDKKDWYPIDDNAHDTYVHCKKAN